MKNFFLLLSLVFSTAVFSQTINSSDTAMRVVPVLRSYVPPDIVAKAVKKYGRMLYCIEKTKAGGDCEDSYLVGLIRNGRLSMEWMCEDLKIAMNKTSRLKTFSL